MGWNYSGDPSASPGDEVRFLIGDTDTNDQLLSDEEIEYLLLKATTPRQAAYDGCIDIAGKFARMATSKSVGDLSITYSDRARAFRDHAASILAQDARRNPPTPWIHPDALVRAADRPVKGVTGTEFWSGQHDNTSG
jgi:hypothetical protein